MFLSVCIPTHQGRANELRDAIESVVGQLDPDIAGRVEVCVSDTGSHDGTEDVVAAFREQHGDAVRYRRTEDPRTFAWNQLRLMEMARGTYCWLMGSDDAVAPGGIRKVVETLERHPELAGVTTNKRNFAADLRGPWEDDPPELRPSAPERFHVYTTADEIFRELGPIQGFMSAQIFSRAAWKAAVDRHGEETVMRFGVAPHLFVIESIVLESPRWAWLPERLVHQRSDNTAWGDSARPLHYRLLLEILEEISAIWTTLHGRTSRRHRVLMRRWWITNAAPRVLATLKLDPRHGIRDDLAMLVGYTRRMYVLPVFVLATLPVLLTPHHVLKALKRGLDWSRGRRGAVTHA
jgi:glycosyltransferase involved in cell wall biosynthesis